MDEYLDLLKQLLGIDFTDTSKDTILNFQLRISRTNIINYLRISEEEYNKEKYIDQTVLLAQYYYTNNTYSANTSSNNDRIKQEVRGNKSITYFSPTEIKGSSATSVNTNIPVSIKSMLPLPLIKFY